MFAYLKYTTIGVAIVVLGAAISIYLMLRASLPRLDGTRRESTLAAEVTIERDQLGVATITAGNRADLAFATGYVHAQDRFFQMDLQRRLAAGELSELVGAAAINQDKATRRFRFRMVARRVIEECSPEQRALLAAYSRGVNAGLGSLRSRPWEYWLLRATPAPWVPEDSILTLHAMWWNLQSGDLDAEILKHEINNRLGGTTCEGEWKCALSFFYPSHTQWDSYIDSVATAAPPTDAMDIPAPSVLDVRHDSNAPTALVLHHVDERAVAGSNAWAVAGTLAGGPALVAGDPHLTESVPTIWYHMRLRQAGNAAATPLDMTGLVLPGTPLVTMGSNGSVAWSFTNSYGSWAHVTAVPCVNGKDDPSWTHVQETIHVHGSPDVTLEVASNDKGVLIRTDTTAGQCWFGFWLAQLPAATNLNMLQMERVTSADEATLLGADIGIPAQNLIVGDRAGHIGWTVFGRIPAGSGEQRWTGSDWTTAANHPRLLDPPSSRIWSANSRETASREQQSLIAGDQITLSGGYALGARGLQIRNDLMALNDQADAAQMLAIQLDDRAVFLTRWHDLILQVLDSQAIAASPQRAQFRQAVTGWNGRADVDSVSYALVAAFHATIRDAVWQQMLMALKIATTGNPPPLQFEHALWLLVTQQPMSMLPSVYQSWRQFLLQQIDVTVAGLQGRCPSLSQCTWGQFNTVRVRHPLSSALPAFAGWLDMPTVQLPGHVDMPRVQNGIHGASARFAVSPGREAEGYFHMPGGQSGHPLSPYYQAGFVQWARGEPLPFLPGPARHVLTLAPDH
jgi:penicillin amidase